MRKIILSVLTIVITFASAYCQEIKTIRATEQSWSGGVCCRYGTNYYISIQVSKENITLDTIWIRGNYYPLIQNIDNTGGNFTWTENLINHNQTLSIKVGESHDQRIDMNPHGTIISGDSVKKIFPPIDYSGDALITYHYKNKKGNYTVKEFQVMPLLAYP